MILKGTMDQNVLNLSSLEERMMNDKEVVNLLLFHFREQIKRDIPEIIRMINENNLRQLCDKLHSLKGASSAASALNLNEILKTMEKDCKEYKGDLLIENIDQLIKNSEECLRYLNNLDSFIAKYGKEESTSFTF